MTGPLVVVGDVLLDVDVEGTVDRICPDAPAPVLDQHREVARAGGAGLAALLAAGDGREVVLVTALAEDAAGKRLRALLAPYVTVVALPDRAATREKVRLRAGGTSLARLDRGGPGRPDPRAGTTAVGEALAAASAVLVSDYAGGTASLPAVRELLAAAARRRPLVWDPHPRGAAPVPRATLATPNEAEARHFAPDAAVEDTDDVRGLGAVELRAAQLARTWQATAVAVTLGPRGAMLSYGSGTPLMAPAPPAACVDPCGAGDRFATTAAGLLADRQLIPDVLVAAVTAAAAYVAAGGAASHPAGVGPLPPSEPVGPVGNALAVVHRVRSAGGRVVATGGCFDLLHAGHVATLRAARALGNCLVVCLNSDASVSRLKGPDRPLVPAEDRARVLAALECVDAVAVFDEDTPEEVLRRLRPDVWAKGGDYAGAALPETPLVRSWGGQSVLLPYLDGRSTTRIVAAAAGRGLPR